jgi:hypothetical protein
MPKSNGETLPYTSREACITAARERGVNESPCMKIPAGGTTPTVAGRTMPRPGGVGGGVGGGGVPRGAANISGGRRPRPAGGNRRGPRKTGGGGY